MLSQKKDDKASQKSSRDTLKELTEVSENNSTKPENKCFLSLLGKLLFCVLNSHESWHVVRAFCLELWVFV